VKAIVIRRGGAGVVLVVAGVVGGGVVEVAGLEVAEAGPVEVVVEVAAGVVVEDPVVTRVPADRSGSDARRRTAETSTVVHATSESPSIRTTRLRIRPGSHAIVTRPRIPWPG
jgi:hypothetical protein